MITLVIISVVGILSLSVIVVGYWLYARQNATDNVVSKYDLPYEYLNDEEALGELMDEFGYGELPPEDQASYLRAQEFYKHTPPHFHNVRGSSMTYNDMAIIREKGILGFEFGQDPCDDPRYVVQDRTEINFHNNSSPYSTCTSVLNYCLPIKGREFSDTIYFETKVFEFPNNTRNGHFLIGLVSKPYPEFRLPGYYVFSIGYESTGNLKINKPLPTPSQQHCGQHSVYNALVLPPLLQGDNVGFGYHISTGTIFITRNGNKLMDVMNGVRIDLYPAIGCFLANAQFHVNLGQAGFVWIEANVRKYGFISTSNFKKIKGERGIAALPLYNPGLVSDKLLAKGEPLPPKYPDNEIDFFGRPITNVYNLGSSSKLNEKHEKESSTAEPQEFNLQNQLYEPNATENTRLLNHINTYDSV